MNGIQIKGLEVNACHGVLAEEKVNPQPFIFDIALAVDTHPATLTDDVADTVNYAEVCALVTDFCKSNGFNLIETLAGRCADLLIKSYKTAKAVQVTVHKPRAPVGLPFADVSVTATAERNTVALSLGSSMGDREQTLKGAIDALKKIDGVTVQKVSPFMKSQPYGGVAENEFLNCALLAECLLTPRELLDEIHRVEADFHRVRGKRWDDRTLDIDIIFFGNKIIAEEGLCIPHPDYQNRPFVVGPLKQIAPDFTCPKLLKRIADL